MIGIYIFAGIVALAGLEVYQYFRGRKINMELIRDSVNILEKILKPVDKEYQMAGLYVGYRAKFIRNEEPRDVLISFLTLPRYSMLYYPVSRILNKGDRFMMVLGYSRDIGRGEVHICDRKFSSKIIEDSDKNFNEKILNNGKVLLYDDPVTAKIFEQIFNNCSLPIRHVAYDPSSKCIYLYSYFSNLEEFEQTVEKVLELAKRLL